MNSQEYIDAYASLAMDQMRRHGIPASITLAQGILESANGGSRLAREANNHFGIKATSSWIKEGGDYMLANDDRPNEKFCAYQSVADSYEHHSRFLTENSRYDRCFALQADDYKGWSRELAAAGYASDPNYASKLQNIIERYGLDRYDKTVTNSKGMSAAASSAAVIGQAGYSMPLDRDEFILATESFGLRQEPGSDVKTLHKEMVLAADDDNILATENGLKVLSADNDRGMLTMEKKNDDGSRVQIVYSGLSALSVRQGNVLSAGQTVGQAKDSMAISVRVITEQGMTRDMDPAAYLADVAAKGNLKCQLYCNGTNLLAQYNDVPQATMEPDAWMKKLLSSEDCGLGTGMGGDALTDIFVSLFTSLMSMAALLDGEDEKQRNDIITKSLQSKTVDLTNMVPSAKECSITLKEDGKLWIDMTGQSASLNRELTPLEQDRINQLLGNGAISAESKGRYLGSFLSGELMRQQASVSFDTAMSESNQRQQGMKM